MEKMSAQDTYIDTYILTMSVCFLLHQHLSPQICHLQTSGCAPRHISHAACCMLQNRGGHVLLSQEALHRNVTPLTQCEAKFKNVLLLMRR